MSHLEQRLENDLSKIRGRVAEQANLVVKAVRDSIHALQTGDRRLAYTTILNDHPVNRYMRQIDRLCHSFIAVHLPSAGHLRLLSAVIRVNIELERIGDYAVTIARESVQLSAPPTGVISRELERMAGETLLTLTQACKAFNELNAEMARSTMPLIEQMEGSLDALYGEMMSSDQHEKIKDTLAIFVVFTQLKRVADQAKNLCEETVFAATGQQKQAKVYKVLFIDEDNGLLSQMAEAVARVNFPESGLYRSAGRTPARAIDEQLTDFLDKRGIKISGETTAIEKLTQQELAEQYIIVSLQGAVESYIPNIPFHTTAVEWNLDENASEGEGSQDMDDLYREIALRVKDLMELLRGEGAS